MANFHVIKNAQTGEVSSVPFTPEEEAAAMAEQEAAAVMQTKREAEAVARLAVKTDSFVQQFISMTPAEVAAYVTGNVTDLASARALLRRLSLMVLVLAKREFDD